MLWDFWWIAKIKNYNKKNCFQNQTLVTLELCAYILAKISEASLRSCFEDKLIWWVKFFSAFFVESERIGPKDKKVHCYENRNQEDSGILSNFVICDFFQYSILRPCQRKTLQRYCSSFLVLVTWLDNFNGNKSMVQLTSFTRVYLARIAESRIECNRWTGPATISVDMGENSLIEYLSNKYTESEKNDLHNCFMHLLTRSIYQGPTGK